MWWNGFITGLIIGTVLGVVGLFMFVVMLGGIRQGYVERHEDNLISEKEEENEKN